jgi:hypothetical protein
MKCLFKRVSPLFVASVAGYAVLCPAKRVAVPKRITRSMALIGIVLILNNY